MNAGEITSRYSTGYIGGVVGCIYSSSQVSHCYWYRDISISAYKYMDPDSSFTGSSFDPTSFELSESVSIGNYSGASLLAALNAYSDFYYLRDYSRWALNKNWGSVSFTINGRSKQLSLNSKIILLPNLASEGRLRFNGWYTDLSCSSPLSIFEFTADKDLYGKWEENANNYVITFDTRREDIPSPEPLIAQFGSVISLPSDPKRGNCYVSFWETDYGDSVPWEFTVPAYNLTLYSVWS